MGPQISHVRCHGKRSGVAARWVGLCSPRQISQKSPPAEDSSASANLRSFFHALHSSSFSLLRPVSPQADRVYLCPVMGPGYFSTQKRFPVTWKHVTGKGITQIRRVEACPNRESQAPVLGML